MWLIVVQIIVAVILVMHKLKPLGQLGLEAVLILKQMRPVGRVVHAVRILDINLCNGTTLGVAVSEK